MIKNPKNPVSLWQELKQRRVVRVVTVYLASAFAILEGTDIITTRLGLPSWPVTLVMILLACGLVAAIVLSWIYDITPEGIIKTPAQVQGDSEERLREHSEIAEGRLAVIDKEDDLMVQANKLYANKIIKYKKKEKIYSLGSAAIIIAAVILFFFSSGSTMPFSKRDWILITDFENLTDNTVFDKSLYTAFSLTINQSRYINVFPRNRMLETMVFMEAENMTYVDEKTGREIASREGISTYIVPGISEVGDDYVLSARIMEAKTGNLLQSVIMESDKKHDILAQLDKMSRKVRKALGESRYQIATQDKPLSKATTSSLEALKQYSLGIESNWFGNFEDAKIYYENALNIDSGFTTARASLGNLLIEKNLDLVKGKELLTRAVNHVDNLTDGEKYGVLASYAVNVENDLPKGIEYLKKLTQLYPDDPTYHHNLAWYYQVSGLYEEAVEEYKITVGLNPIFAMGYQGINWIYLDIMGKLDSAYVWSKKMISDNPQNAWGYFDLGSAYIGLDSINQAENAFQKARELNPYFMENLYRLVLTYHIQGKYKEAIRLLERMIEIGQFDNWTYYYLGISYLKMEDQSNAEEYFRQFENIATDIWMKHFPDEPSTYLAIAKARALMGDIESSEQMLQKALEINATPNINYAEVYCLQGKLKEAIVYIDSLLYSGYRELTWLKLDPNLDKLHDDTRFKELLDKYFE